MLSSGRDEGLEQRLCLGIGGEDRRSEHPSGQQDLVGVAPGLVELSRVAALPRMGNRRDKACSRSQARRTLLAQREWSYL